jgi:hypothetical protein
LFCVDWGEGFDGFQLEEELIFDDEVGSEAFVESMPSKTIGTGT